MPGATRFLTALLTLLLSASCFAASIADRSPFAQGLWWDPTKSGHGFQIFNAADQAMVVWYTYDNLGQPTWYTAQSDLASVGTTWPLLKHRWVNGRKADPTQVGTLRLEFRHPEGASLNWTVGGSSGAWSIQPFTVAGVINEVDHTGLWYDPANSGWGISLLEQGDVQGGILFGYGPSGDPTWAAGFDRTPGRVNLYSYVGPCPVCSYVAPTTRNIGQLTFDFRGESDLVLGSNLGLAMAPGTNLDGARLIPLTRPASTRPADRQLASFPSEPTLKAFLDAGMLNVNAMPGGPVISASPPTPASTSYSTTNLIEAGVDEADLVKSNGRYVYTYATDGYGNRAPVIRVGEVLDDGAGFAIRGSVALASGSSTPMANAGLYLDGDNLVSVTGPGPYAYAVPVAMSPISWSRGTTLVEVLGVSNPAAPATRWRAEIDGYLVASRRIGQRLYVVSRHTPYLPGFVYGAGSNTVADMANRQLLANTPIAALLPSVRINGGGPSPVVGATEIYAPPQGSRPVVAEMVLVSAIDLAAPRIAQSLAIVGGFEALYASMENLYVATSRYPARSPTGLILPVQPYAVLTDIHQVALGANAMTIAGSGSVEGLLSSDVEQAAFRMSEYQGKLRAVTSANAGMWWGPSATNRLTILQASTVSPGLLKTVSYLPNARRPEMLGKPNEYLYSTRFANDRLYAVTFKSIDPLYVVDAADASDPKIAGQLVLPGFSSYLHPLPNGLLLGFGKDTLPSDATGDGNFAWYQGLQLTLFDVSNAGQPREMQRMIFGKRGSDSALLRDHHAFSVLANADGSRSLAFPASIHDGYPMSGNGPSANYPWQQSGLLRVELRGSAPANAQLAQSASLITHTMINQPTSTFSDPAYHGRSILFPQGTLYIGNGQFWRQDKQGQVTGPY